MCDGLSRHDAGYSPSASTVRSDITGDIRYCHSTRNLIVFNTKAAAVPERRPSAQEPGATEQDVLSVERRQDV